MAQSERWRRRELLVKQQVASLADRARKIDRQIDTLAAERDVLARERDALKAAVAKSQPGKGSFAVLPYKGANGSWRRPIVLECANGTVTLRPKGPTFSLLDLSTMINPRSNPVILAIARELLRVQMSDSPDGSPVVPYFVFLVRPDGIRPYYEIRARLEPLGIAFGYELVEQELPDRRAGLRQSGHLGWDHSARGATPRRARPRTRSGRIRQRHGSSRTFGNGDGSGRRPVLAVARLCIRGRTWRRAGPPGRPHAEVQGSGSAAQREEAIHRAISSGRRLRERGLRPASGRSSADRPTSPGAEPGAGTSLAASAPDGSGQVAEPRRQPGQRRKRDRLVRYRLGWWRVGSVREPVRLLAAGRATRGRRALGGTEQNQARPGRQRNGADPALAQWPFPYPPPGTTVADDQDGEGAARHSARHLATPGESWARLALQGPVVRAARCEPCCLTLNPRPTSQADPAPAAALWISPVREAAAGALDRSGRFGAGHQAGAEDGSGLAAAASGRGRTAWLGSGPDRPSSPSLRRCDPA